MKINVATLLEEAQCAEEAGFTQAAHELRTKAERARKLAIAYEHFRFVSEERVKEFTKTLVKKTTRPATEADRQKFGIYTSKVADTLVFQAMEAYPGLPPKDVLEKTKAAKAMNCFDSFEVAEIQPIATEVKLPDPIVFGRVEGCTDRFYVAEWGTDVSINDLLEKHEG